MYNEYDTFILTEPLADLSVPIGTRGVVLMVLQGNPIAYEVEFPDGRGGNLGKEGTYTITADHMYPDPNATTKK